MKYFKIIALSVGLCTSTAYAQDFHLSLYDESSLNLNPALTGQFNGKMRIHGHFRTQWSAISTVPFTTALLSFDMPYKHGLSFGAQIGNFNAGKGLYNVFSLLPSISYRAQLKKFHMFSFGMQLGFFNKSLQLNKLTFENQYVVENGGQFDSSLPSGESITRASMFNLDVNAGMMYYYAKRASKLNPFAGLTIFHLNNPKEGFYNSENRLPLRYLFHAGTRIVLNKKWQLLPRMLFMYEKKAMEFTITAVANYYLEQYDVILMGGITYRSKDAMIIEFGANYDRYTVRLAYDINVSDLNVNTQGRGGFELALTYIIPNLTPNPKLICPKL